MAVGARRMNQSTGSPPKKKPARKKRDPMELVKSKLKGLYEKYVEKDAVAESYEDELVEVLTVLKRLKQEGGEFVTSDGQFEVSATVVSGSRLIVDEAALKEKIGAAAYNKLTTPKLDMRKVEAALALNQLSEKHLAECSEEKPNKEYIRWTPKKVKPS